MEIYIVRQSDDGLTVETSAKKFSTVAKLH